MSVSGVPVWLKYDIYVSLPGKKGTAEREENDQKFFAWMKKKKLLSLRILTLPYQRMKSIVGDLLLEGKPAPDGVKYTFRTSLCVNKRGPGGGEREEE
jgi:hypothetical protein